MKRTFERLKSVVGRNEVQLMALFLILLMVFSTLAVVGEFFSKKQEDAEHIGVWEGFDVFKKADHDYFMLVKNVEWHFRANPLDIVNISVLYNRDEPPNDMYFTGKIRGFGVFVPGSIILMNPNASAREVAATTEIAQALGYVKAKGEEGLGNFEVAFTEKAENRPDIMVLPEADAINISRKEGKVVFYVFGPDEGANDTYVWNRGGSDSKFFRIHGKDYDDLDKSAGKVKLMLLDIYFRQSE